MSTIITEKVYKEQQKNDRISQFFQKFEISKAVKSGGFYKRKGTQPVDLLKYVFSLVFRNSNIYLANKNRPADGKNKNTIFAGACYPAERCLYSSHRRRRA